MELRFPLCLIFLFIGHGHASNFFTYLDYNYTLSATKEGFWTHYMKGIYTYHSWPITFNSNEEYEAIGDWLRNDLKFDADVQIWTGLSAYHKENFEYIDGAKGPIDTLWAEGEPSAKSKRCAILKNGQFIAKNCGENIQALSIYKTRSDGSQKPPNPFPDHGHAGPCPQGFIPFIQDPSRCFKMVTLNHVTGLTYQEAREACEALHPQSVLATVKDWEKFQLVSMMTEKVSGYWIGLNKLDTKDGVWEDNSQAKYGIHIHEMAYGDKCGTIAYIHHQKPKPGDLQYETCDHKKGYICQAFALPKDTPAPPQPPPNTQCDAYPGFEPHGDNCYHFIAKNQSWLASESQCKEMGGSLASIHSVPENAFIQLIAHRHHSEHHRAPSVWIGMYKPSGHREPWRWSNGWSITYWNSKEDKVPSASVPEWMYLHPYDGTWHATRPQSNENYYGVCKVALGDPVKIPEETDTFCPPDWWYRKEKYNMGKYRIIWENLGQQCYNITTGTTHSPPYYTVMQAIEECAYRNRNAFLGTIHDEATLHYLVDRFLELRGYYADTDTTGLWLGLYKNKHGKWAWFDGSPLDFTNWLPGSPRVGTSDEKNCAFVHTEAGNKRYYWEDTQCTEKKNFMCMVNKEPHYEEEDCSGGSCGYDCKTGREEPGPFDGSQDESWSRFRGDCYGFYPNKDVSRDEAARFCEEVNGATLVTIANEDENKFVRSELFKQNKHNFHKSYWIGLKATVQDLSDNKKIENRWDNDNYNHPPYLNYYPGEPVVAGSDVVCVTMDTEHGLWVTAECFLPKGFVCKVNNKLLPQNQGYVPNAGEAIGIMIGAAAATLLLVTALFYGVVKLMKANKVPAPSGFANKLYDLVD